MGGRHSVNQQKIKYLLFQSVYFYGKFLNVLLPWNYSYSMCGFFFFPGHILNYTCFTRFSTDVTKHKYWTLLSKLQLGPHQPFKRLVRWSSANANTGSIGAGETEKLSILQRFKKTYKEHGKVLVGVHVVTSLMWYGSFYLTLSRWVVYTFWHYFPLFSVY